MDKLFEVWENMCLADSEVALAGVLYSGRNIYSLFIVPVRGVLLLNYPVCYSVSARIRCTPPGTKNARRRCTLKRTIVYTELLSKIVPNDFPAVVVAAELEKIFMLVL